MRNCITIVLLYLNSILFISCSNDDTSENSIIGTWELTTWTINIPIDLNNDGVISNNLLDEATCDNFEILVFDANGNMSSSATYNPQITISIDDATMQIYGFDVVCDNEGTIGFSSSYSQNNNTVSFSETLGFIDGNQFTIVYDNAINIYNEELSEIVNTKDLTLVYTRK